MSTLRDAAVTTVKDCLGLQPGESVLIITDTLRHTIGRELYEVCLEMGNETMIMEMKPRQINGEEPPEAISEAMKRVDVVICPTTKSLSHTDARRNACAAGARVGTMPGITEDIMRRTMQADYHAIAKRTRIIADILTNGREAHVRTAAGTDIRLPIEGIKAKPSTGLVLEKGDFGNLPSGEAFLMPRENESEGIIVVDGSLAGIGLITDEPVRFVIEKGMAVAIEGGAQARQFEEIVNGIGQQARNLAELGVGTNDVAQINGTILEDEKVMGTVHLALGNNVSMGGTVNVGFHVDGVLLKPTLTIDGQVILKDGDLLV